VRVNGKDLGHGQLEGGLAWWYTQYSKEQSPQRYSRPEDAAKAARAGLWAEPQARCPRGSGDTPARASRPLGLAEVIVGGIVRTALAIALRDTYRG